MINKITCFFISTLFLISSYGQGKIAKFKIDGKIQGYNNGTLLYLHDLSDGSYKKIDSTVIANDIFTFSGQLKTKYLKTAISTNDFADRTTFWLEKGLTLFTAEKDRFNKAVIKGSKIQEDQNSLNKLIENSENIKEAEYCFVKHNPNSIISAYVLSVYCSSWNKETVSVLYKSFSKEVKQTVFAKKIFAFLSLNRNLKIGDKFVDFSQKDTAGKVVKLSDIKSDCILLEFWGSWCGPCREENPSLVKIYSEFKQKGFEILGVASETNKHQWTKAIRADGLNWINVSDLKGSGNKAAMIYGVSGYPSNFLIDKGGTIIAKDVYGDDLRNWLLKIL
ncbi:MAG TPA: AhpC/TSA family protein [Sediminibacterium sp.]|nr:AhpC/TSA family protein [Sediminibacterium sp.]